MSVSKFTIPSILDDIMYVLKLYNAKYKKINNCVFESCLLCASCWEIQNDLYCLMCGHVICEKCLKKNYCSTCNYRNFLPSNIAPNYLLNSLNSDVLNYMSEFQSERKIVNNLINESKYSEALVLLTKLLKYEFCVHLILSLRIKVYIRMKEYEKAYEDVVLLTSVARNWKKAYYLKSKVLKLNGKLLESVESLISGLLLDPYDEKMISRLVKLLHELLTTEFIKSHIILDQTFPSLILHDELVSFIRKCIKKQYEDQNIFLQLNYPKYLNIFQKTSSLVSINQIIDEKENERQKFDQNQFIGSILNKEHFECPLCLKIYLKPVALSCGHTFCQHCIQRALFYSSNCPLCKYNLSSYLQCSEIPLSVNIEKLINFVDSINVAKYEYQHLNQLKYYSLASNRCTFMICMVAMPGMQCDLHIFEPRYRCMIHRAIESGTNQFGIVLPRSPSGHHEIGSILEIKEVQLLEDGRSNVFTVAQNKRYQLKSSSEWDGCLVAELEEYVDLSMDDEKLRIFESKLASLYQQTVKWINSLSSSIRSNIFRTYGSLPEPSPLFSAVSTPSQRQSSTSSYTPYKISRRRYSVQSNPLIDANYNRPSLWIWWLCAVLPLDDYSKYQLFSTNQPIDRLDQLKVTLDCIMNSGRSFSSSHQ